METKSTESPTAQVCEPHTGEGAIEIYIDPIKEARMMRKFDFCAIGLLGLFYMMANLDRSNIGNAQTAGMPQDLGLVGNQFGTATTLLYATYVPFEGPVAILLKIIGPKPLLSTCAFCWGITTLGMAFIQSWKGLYACRLLTGFFEAGLIPCINVYIALVYKKSERGKRSAVIFAFSAFSSAFGGILAYGLTQVHGPHGWEGWRWLFAVEGAMTLVLVPMFFCLFPKHTTTAWFLTSEEKSMMQARYDNDPHWGQDEAFTWAESLSAFADPKWWAFWIYQFSVDISLYGFTTFLPKIVSGLGYSGVHANLMTVPIYMVGLVWFLTIAYCSDRVGLRGPFLAGPLLCLIIGYAILISVESVKVRFFACFVVALGIYPTTGLSLMWLQDNTARHFKRATMVGMTLCFGNTAGVAVGQIFTTQSAPRYIKGLSISLALAVVALAMVAALSIGMMIVNKKRAVRMQRAEEAGEVLEKRPEKGDYDVYFRQGVSPLITNGVAASSFLLFYHNLGNQLFMAPPAKRQRRIYVACRRCHSQKIKCSGIQPCRACCVSGNHDQCQFPPRDRKVSVSETYIKKLEGEVRDLRAQQQRPSAASPSETTYEAPSVANDQGQNPAQFTDTDVSNPLLESPTGFVAAGSSSPPVYIGEASCVAFGDTLLQCVDKDTDLAAWPPPTYFQHEIFNRLVRPDLVLPDRIQSRLLVGVAVRFIGTDYHLLLKKTFYEKLDRICAGEEPRDLVWICKFFILLALGEMYSNRQRRNTSQRVPGTDYFLQATGLLQDLYETPSVEQVEVMILFCFYANALGRTKSAYTYIGIAMRMALALGLHRNLPTDTMLNPVEREHRKRVWWTLYTLDRLCSSILGYPLLISDSLIDVELPTDEGLSASEQEEFSDPAHLIATIKLARITGQILSDLYCLPQRTHEPFVQRVHRILLSLRKWDEELPAKLSLQQEHLPRHVTSLHLHYNKCVISTTRPILLYLFKHRFSLTADAAGVTPPPTFSPTTLALAESCVQAARASNSILSRCFVEGSLASFGYFDAHYLFSSSLILIMSAVMDPNVAMSDAISYAFTILKAMKEDGNIPSCDYYERLQRTRASVGKMRENHETGSHSPVLASGGETMWEAQIPPHEADGPALGFSEGVPLGHPLIDSFLADKAFVRADGLVPEDQSLRDLACELGDEFLFGAQ